MQSYNSYSRGWLLSLKEVRLTHVTPRQRASPSIITVRNPTTGVSGQRPRSTATGLAPVLDCYLQSCSRHTATYKCPVNVPVINIPRNRAAGS